MGRAGLPTQGVQGSRLAEMDVRGVNMERSNLARGPILLALRLVPTGIVGTCFLSFRSKPKEVASSQIAVS